MEIYIYIKPGLNYTYPAENMKQLLQQRKRWALGGAKGFTWFWKCLFGIFGMYHLSLFLLLFLNPWLAFVFFSVKYILQLFINIMISVKLRLKINYISLLTYELYNIYFNSLLSFAILMPGVVWKGRKY